MAIPSVFPMFMKATESTAISETIIIGGLVVDVSGAMAVQLGQELSVTLERELNTPVPTGPLTVKLEGELNVEMDACQ